MLLWLESWAIAMSCAWLLWQWWCSWFWEGSVVAMVPWLLVESLGDVANPSAIDEKALDRCMILRHASGGGLETEMVKWSKKMVVLERR